MSQLGYWSKKIKNKLKKNIHIYICAQSSSSTTCSRHIQNRERRAASRSKGMTSAATVVGGSGSSDSSRACVRVSGGWSRDEVSKAAHPRGKYAAAAAAQERGVYRLKPPWAVNTFLLWFSLQFVLYAFFFSFFNLPTSFTVVILSNKLINDR